MHRAGGVLRRTLRLRGGGGGGGWWTPGKQDATGNLFAETPPPPGQSRKWESWELPYYTTCVLTVIILGVGLNAKPDTRIDKWAHEEALRRLKANGELEERDLIRRYP